MNFLLTTMGRLRVIGFLEGLSFIILLGVAMPLKYLAGQPEAVVIFDGKEKRTIKTADIEEKKILKQSSMPEGLAGAMSPGEFLDLLAYMGSLK